MGVKFTYFHRICEFGYKYNHALTHHSKEEKEKKEENERKKERKFGEYMAETYNRKQERIRNNNQIFLSVCWFLYNPRVPDCT